METTQVDFPLPPRKFSPSSPESSLSYEDPTVPIGSREMGNLNTPSTVVSTKTRNNDRISKDDAAKERRRAQIRRATQAYRVRKESAVSSLSQRVDLLENAVEQMNEEFLGFSGEMLELAREKPELAKRLRDKTERFLKLAQALEKDEEIAGRETSRHRKRVSHSIPSTWDLKRETFQPGQYISPLLGNSWPLTLEDILRNNFEEPSFQNGIYNSIFSRRLFYYTLTLALSALRSSSSTSAFQHATNMFRYARTHRSKSEIETAITISLNIGAPVDLVFLQNRPDSVPFGPPSKKTVATKALSSTVWDKEPFREDYLDAAGTEDYLRKKGAFYFDSQIIQMMVPAETHTPWNSTITPQDSRRGFVSEEVVSSDLLAPSVLDQDTAFSSSREHPYFSNFVTQQVITLNARSLLHHISEMSVCIGTGPGYLASNIDQAIASSVVLAS